MKCSNAAKRKGEERPCAQCGELFYSPPSQGHHRYCSQSCWTTAKNLTDANPSYHRDISGERNPMYGKGFKGETNPMFGRKRELNPNWSGGRKIRKDGYILTIAPDDHPYPSDTSSGTRYILEHRLIMEQKLGRYLTPEEVVHHLDENPSNNHPDNLALLPSQAVHASHHFKGKKRKKAA